MEKYPPTINTIYGHDAVRFTPSWALGKGSIPQNHPTFLTNYRKPIAKKRIFFTKWTAVRVNAPLGLLLYHSLAEIHRYIVKKVWKNDFHGKMKWEEICENTMARRIYSTTSPFHQCAHNAVREPKTQWACHRGTQMCDYHAVSRPVKDSR